MLQSLLSRSELSDKLMWQYCLLFIYINTNKMYASIKSCLETQ